MKSRITLDFVDFEGKGAEPVIRVDLNPSDDVRDNLLKSIFQASDCHLEIQYGHQEIEHGTEGFTKRSKIYLRAKRES